MPKRHQQNKRALRKDDRGPGESADFDADADGIPNIKRLFILTPLADHTLRDAVTLFSRATGTDMTNSHLFRVLLKAVAHAMPEIEREVAQLGKLKRPSNARTNQVEREEFERKLAAAVVSAFRKCRPFDPGAEDN
jgi:hypothetical protein